MNPPTSYQPRTSSARGGAPFRPRHHQPTARHPYARDSSVPRRHEVSVTPGERACRSLFIRNIDFGASARELREAVVNAALEPGAERAENDVLRSTFQQIEGRGIAFFHFYDLRSAIRAKDRMHNHTIGKHSRAVDVHFSLPRGADADKRSGPCSREDAQGSLLLSLSSGNASADQTAGLRSFLETFGEVKEFKSRSEPSSSASSSPLQRITVEFYDIRACQRAYDEMSQDPTSFQAYQQTHQAAMHGSPIKVEVEFAWDEETLVANSPSQFSGASTRPASSFPASRNGPHGGGYATGYQHQQGPSSHPARMPYPSSYPSSSIPSATSRSDTYPVYKQLMEQTARHPMGGSQMMQQSFAPVYDMNAPYPYGSIAPPQSMYMQQQQQLRPYSQHYQQQPIVSSFPPVPSFPPPMDQSSMMAMTMSMMMAQQPPPYPNAGYGGGGGGGGGDLSSSSVSSNPYPMAMPMNNAMPPMWNSEAGSGGNQAPSQSVTPGLDANQTTELLNQLLAQQRDWTMSSGASGSDPSRSHVNLPQDPRLVKVGVASAGSLSPHGVQATSAPASPADVPPSPAPSPPSTLQALTLLLSSSSGVAK